LYNIKAIYKIYKVSLKCGNGFKKMRPYLKVHLGSEVKLTLEPNRTKIKKKTSTLFSVSYHIAFYLRWDAVHRRQTNGWMDGRTDR